MTGASPSLARLAMRLRAATGAPVGLCRDFLFTLGAERRQAYVEYMEEGGLRFFVDPVELDVSVRNRLDGLRTEARRLLQLGDFGPPGRGARRMTGWVKSEMLRRYGISWRSAAEMNPHCAFD